MPKSSVKYPVVIAVRLEPSDLKKLEHLCTTLYRGRGDMLRLLIRQAMETGLPDVCLEPAATATRARRPRGAATPERVSV
jgi:hypothetical protein